MAGISNHYDSLIALQSLIIGLSLPGITDTGDAVPVYLQEVLDYKSPDISSPCVLIAPWGAEWFDETTQFNNQDAPVYGCAIAIVADPDDTRYTLEQRLGWRQTIRRHMKNQDLSAHAPSGSFIASGNFNLNCKPFPVVDAKAWLVDRKFISGMLVEVFWEENRS